MIDYQINKLKRRALAGDKDAVYAYGLALLRLGGDDKESDKQKFGRLLRRVRLNQNFMTVYYVRDSSWISDYRYVRSYPSLYQMLLNVLNEDCLINGDADKAFYDKCFCFENRVDCQACSYGDNSVHDFIRLAYFNGAEKVAPYISRTTLSLGKKDCNWFFTYIIKKVMEEISFEEALDHYAMWRAGRDVIPRI